MVRVTSISIETVYVWELYPHMIQWHQHHRRFLPQDVEESTRAHINALLIMSSAVMIEGCLCTLLKFYVSGTGSPLKPGRWTLDPISLLSNRIRENLAEEITKSTWRDLKNRLFKVVTGKDLKDLAGEHWEPVDHLFDFRNLLSHGEEINIQGEVVASDGLPLKNVRRNKERLFTFLEGCGFLHPPAMARPMGWSLLSDQVADFFVQHARAFLSCTVAQCPDSDHVQSLPKRIRIVLDATDTPGPEFDEPIYRKEHPSEKDASH